MEAPARPYSPATARQQRWVWLAVFGLLVLTGLVEWWFEHRKESRYDEQIVRVAQRYAVDPALVKALIWRESKFNSKVRGKVGEIGLMQIRSLAAQEWAQAQAPPRSFEGNLFEPETNLVVGTWYLSKLVKRYSRTDNAIPYALADYNAGRANVLRWIRGPAQTNSAAFVAQISFPGTQNYVRSIIDRSVRYQRSFQQKGKPGR